MRAPIQDHRPAKTAVLGVNYILAILFTTTHC